MTSYVKFPNMFSGEIKISRVAFSVFGMDIYWYGIIITLGVILALLFALKNAKKVGMVSDHVFDTAFCGAVFGIIGARLYYVIFYNLSSSTHKYTLLTAITSIRDGGLAIYGGIIGGVLAAFIYTRIKKIKLLPILDLAGISFLIGQGIGRWGNFFNQEAYGAPTADNLPWGMTGSRIANEVGESLVHPCFLYEFILCLVGVILLNIYMRKFRTFDGEIFLLYVAWYGIGRGFIEGLRTDSLYIGNIRVSQLIGFATGIFAIILLIYIKVSSRKVNI